MATLSGVAEMRVDGDHLTVTVEGREVRVSRYCPHRGGPLEEGVLRGAFLRCPWHGATFDLRSGACLRGPVCPDLEVETATAESPR